MKPLRKGTKNLRKLAMLWYPDLIDDYNRRKKEREEMLDKYGPKAKEEAKRIIKNTKRKGAGDNEY